MTVRMRARRCVASDPRGAGGVSESHHGLGGGVLAHSAGCVRACGDGCVRNCSQSHGGCDRPLARGLRAEERARTRTEA